MPTGSQQSIDIKWSGGPAPGPPVFDIRLVTGRAKTRCSVCRGTRVWTTGLRYFPGVATRDPAGSSPPTRRHVCHIGTGSASFTEGSRRPYRAAECSNLTRDSFRGDGSSLDNLFLLGRQSKSNGVKSILKKPHLGDVTLEANIVSYPTGRVGHGFQRKSIPEGGAVLAVVEHVDEKRFAILDCRPHPRH